MGQCASAGRCDLAGGIHSVVETVAVAPHSLGRSGSSGGSAFCGYGSSSFSTSSCGACPMTSDDCICGDTVPGPALDRSVSGAVAAIGTSLAGFENNGRKQHLWGGTPRRAERESSMWSSDSDDEGNYLWGSRPSKTVSNFLRPSNVPPLSIPGAASAAAVVKFSQDAIAMMSGRTTGRVDNMLATPAGKPKGTPAMSSNAVSCGVPKNLGATFGGA